MGLDMYLEKEYDIKNWESIQDKYQAYSPRMWG